MATEDINQPRQDKSTFGGYRQYLETLFTMACNYWTLFKDIVTQLWQYMEFRILVYIFFGLSFIPLSIFLLFCTCLSSFIFFVAAGIWLFVGTIAFFVLLPFLIGSFGVAVGLVLTYQGYIFLTTSFVSNQRKGDDDDDDLVVHHNRK